MRKTKQIVAIILVVCLTMMLGGCRYSDTMEEILYSAYKDGAINLNAPFQMAENELDNEDKSDQLKDLEQQDDSERKNESESLGLAEDSDEADTDSGYMVAYSNSGKSTGTSDQTKKTSDADNAVTNADEGSDSKSNDGQTDSNGGGTDHSDEDSSSVGHSSPTKEEENGKDGVTGDDGEDPNGDNSEDTDKTIVSPGGEQEPIPTGDTVAAVGALAEMLVILGCEDSLIATDAQTATKAQNISAFEGLSSAEALWEGDGLAGLGSAGFDRLMELKPDLILELSGTSTFSDAQISALKANGSKYLSLAAMTTAADIETDMYTLGGMLGDEAKQRAEDYITWMDSTLSELKSISNKYETCYTLYVDDWDFDVQISLDGTVLEQGAAVIDSYKNEGAMCISNLLTYAGVRNTSSIQPYSASKFRGYFLPMTTLEGNEAFSFTGGALGSMVYSRSYAWTTPNSLAGTEEENKMTELPYALGGGEAFQYILAADQYVAAGINDSKETEYGMWSIFTDKITNESGDIEFVGYNLGSRMVASRLAQDGSYDVLVNPQGYSDWTKGGCESVLEAVWAAYSISGIIDESTMENYILEFYSNFYNTSLTDEELSGILEGN